MYKYNVPQPQENSEQDKTPKSEAEERSVEIKAARLHRGPSTTLMIECPELGISPFSLDIVNSVYHKHAKFVSLQDISTVYTNDGLTFKNHRSRQTASTNLLCK